jgi:hypothetical protein
MDAPFVGHFLDLEPSFPVIYGLFDFVFKILLRFPTYVTEYSNQQETEWYVQNG